MQNAAIRSKKELVWEGLFGASAHDVLCMRNHGGIDVA